MLLVNLFGKALMSSISSGVLDKFNRRDVFDVLFYSKFTYIFENSSPACDKL